MNSQFTVVENKGFQMKFDNGNTISVMFGAGNYCENKKKAVNDTVENSKDAEVAIWNENNEDYKFKDVSGITTNGWCSTDEVAKWIDFAANNTF